MEQSTLFVQRIAAWAEEVAATAPEAVLAETLANPTVRGGLVHLLSEVGVDREISEATQLRERALARGLAEREALRERAGGFKPTTWVSDHLKISRQAVDKRRKAGKLLAMEAPDGSFEYPFMQFAPSGVVPGLEQALASLAAEEIESPWEKLSALVNPSPALSGRSVIEVLRDAADDQERQQALAVVRQFLR